MSTLEEKIAVMRAFQRGKPVVAMDVVTREVVTAGNPNWDWAHYEYFELRNEKTRARKAPQFIERLPKPLTKVEVLASLEQKASELRNAISEGKIS